MAGLGHNALSSIARALAGAVLAIGAILASLPVATGAELLPCQPFTPLATAAAAPRDGQHWRDRFDAIKATLGAKPDRVLFLGDSITERWAPEIWQRNFAPLDAVNAGIDGDRTEHLLWRIDNGDLRGPPPGLVVLLIGTNDLGHGRTPALAAEGIRADLARLRERLPTTPILLLGLTPRSDRFGRAVDAVNRLIRTCGGGLIAYDDPGPKLRDRQGRIPPGILLDGVHFTAAGYEALARELKPRIERLLPR